MNYLVLGMNKNNEVVFYTGKAGEGWVSFNKSEAFPYNQFGAERKAELFNAMTTLHGIKFAAVKCI